MAFSEGGLGETALWPPKSGFPQKTFLISYPTVLKSQGS